MLFVACLPLPQRQSQCFLPNASFRLAGSNSFISADCLRAKHQVLGPHNQSTVVQAVIKHEKTARSIVAVRTRHSEAVLRLTEDHRIPVWCKGKLEAMDAGS